MFASLKSDVRYKEGMAITKHGKTVARLVPVEAKALPLLGRMKGTITIPGDIVGPTQERWEADE